MGLPFATILIILMSFAATSSNVHAKVYQPMDYELTLVENIWGEQRGVFASDMNEAGVVVGYSRNFSAPSDHRAFRFFQNQDGSWTTEDLNDLDDIYGATWTDLDTGGEDPWIAAKASGINGKGQIIGTASHEAHADRVFVLSFPQGLTPKFTLLPRFGSGSNDGTAINDDGVVVGKANGGAIVCTPWTETAFEPHFLNIAAYGVDINNKGVFVTFSGNYNSPIAASRVTPIDNGDNTYRYSGATVDPFANVHFFGINEDGAISGRREPVGRGRNKTPGGPIRIDRFGAEKLLKETSSLSSRASDINNAGDVCYAFDGALWVYFTEADTSFEFDGQTSHAINDIGQICGSGGSGGFILTPITNDPIPGITVSPTSGLVTTETVGGDPATFTVKLDTVPEYPVIIDLSSSDEFLGTINGATNNVLTLEFTDDSSQTVTVTGVDDDPPISDGPHPYTIITEAAVSIDSAYSGLDVDDVSITNLDNDAPPGGGTYNFPLPEEWLLFPMSIPDRSTVPSTIVVPFADDFQIANMTVNLDISHDRPSDLRVTLIGPDGTTEAPLFNFTGDNIVTTFDNDWTGDTIWILKIRDVKKKQDGTLNGWSITVETQ